MNLAHNFVIKTGKCIEGCREEFDGCCIDFAGDFHDWLSRGRMAYFDNLDNWRWRYHCAVEIDGIVHDLWQDRPMPLAEFMETIGALTVEYPCEETEKC